MDKNELKDDYKLYASRGYEEIQDINNNKIDTPKNLLMTELYNYPERSNPESERSNRQTSLERHFSKVELEKMGIPTQPCTTSSENATGYAVFKMLFPHIAGFVIGCAVARILTLGFTGYVITGIIFAFLVGVHKSTYNDQISLKYAVIKNIVLILIEFALILLFAGIYGIIYLIG